MSHFSRWAAVLRFGRDQFGANLVEYVILVGVIALVAIAGFQFFGETVRAKTDQQATHVMQIGN
jgi:pilus assembly protein Flp/PilA